MKYWIAVVDDDAMSLTKAKTLLTAQGMRVSCLRSGGYLMRFIEYNSPDLILLDIQMPGTDGFETFRNLRKFESEMGRKNIPVIFLSGNNDKESEHSGLKIGAADFIRKPFDPDILISRINNALSNKRYIENLIEEVEHDKLTGFLSKSFGTKKIAKMCAEKNGALLIMDIDSFKLVNDLYGHNTGDRVLEIFSDTVRRNVKADDVVCRIGGDEFLAFIYEMNEESAVAALTKQLNDQFFADSEKYIGEPIDFPLGISIGAAFAPIHSDKYDILFQYADQSLYTVKQNGKHGYGIYNSFVSEEYNGEDLECEIARVMQIIEERGAGKGAMFLGQESFAWNYRMMMRFIKRYKGEASIIIFSVSAKQDSAKNVFVSDAALEFGMVLQNTLRISDLIFQNRPNQFLLFLPELSEDNVKSVAERIIRTWDSLKTDDTVDIKYSSKSISFKD